MALRTFTRLGCALALLLCAGAPLHAAPGAIPPASAPPPIERFFSNPLMADAKLSPNARYLAAVSGAPGRRDYLVVIDLQQKTPKLVAGYQDADILHFDWVNDGRLVFNLADKQVGPGEVTRAAGLFAVMTSRAAWCAAATRYWVYGYAPMPTAPSGSARP